MSFRMHSLSSRIAIVSYCCLVLTFLDAPWVRAQTLDSLGLSDLSEFHDPGEDWKIAGGAWGLWDSTELNQESGSGVLVRTVAASDDDLLATKWSHGDLILELEYLIPAGSESGILLQGRYEVQISDSWGIEHPRALDAAGITPRFDASRPSGRQEFEGHPPRVNAAKSPGLWQQLRIVFEAPRFDDGGSKSSDARIVEVVHNGVKVQESVRMGGPTRGALFTDEQSSGPLVLQGSGPVAFRNIRYRHYEPVEPVSLTDVRYTLFRGEFESLRGLTESEPEMSGAAFGYVWDLFGTTADRFGVIWTGSIHIPRSGDYAFSMRFNWIDEIPYEEDAVAGQGRFTIDNHVVIDHTGSDSTATGRIELEEGEYPFTFSYFKNRRLWRPIVFFRVEGPGMPSQYLNGHRTLPEPETSYPPMPVAADREPYVLRSFGSFSSTTKTNVVSVGSPERVHYALDLDSGALLCAWKGSFVDVGSMWTGRGELQLATPRGQRIDISDQPTVALLAHADAAWPSASEGNGIRFDGYGLDVEGQPVFRYSGAGIAIEEMFEPEQNGRRLTRRLTFTGRPSTGKLWIRVSGGKQVMERRPGVWDIDGSHFIELPAGSRPLLRDNDGLAELLVSVPPDSDAAEFSYSIIW